MKEINYKISFRQLATLEIIEANDWYESQKEGLGNEFLNELDFFYQKLLQNPNIYSHYINNVRSGKLNRFPYLVIYEIFDEDSVVYSVFMAKQHPSKKRIR